MGDPAFTAHTVTIVGTGLLGASLGLALKARTSVATVLGVSRSPEGLQEALNRGAVDRAAPDIATAAAESDCLVLCTPVGSMGPLLATAAPALRPDAVVTDVGSTKANVVRDACAAWAAAPARFIGAHPMAGAEMKGAAHGRADLFDGQTVILTPHAAADPGAVAQARALWEAVGGRVCCMTPETHDRVVARTSHLPHLMATVLTRLVASLDRDGRAAIASGFLDTTRVAAGDPEMWRDICLSNADAIRAVWPEITAGLEELRALLDARDGDGLYAYFARQRDLRASLGPNNGRAIE